MIDILIAYNNDFQIIRHIFFATWPEVYGVILSVEQLDYMLEKFYSVDALIDNSNNNQIFFIVKEQQTTAVRFFAIEHDFKLENTTRLHKLYVLPTFQGQNVGRIIFDFIESK